MLKENLYVHNETLLLSSGNVSLQYIGNKNKPTLICLHGWLDNSATFYNLANTLADDYLLLLIDLPGHGLSEPLPVGAHYYIWQYVEVLYEILSCLELENVSLLGHSMGGIVASLFAGTFADKVASLILLDSLGPMVSTAEQAPSQLAKAIQETVMQGSAIKEKFNKEKSSKENIKINSGLRVFASEYEALLARKKSSTSVGMTDQALMPIVLRNLKKVGDGFSWSTDKRLRQTSKVRLTEEQLHAFYSSITASVLVICADKGIIPEAWKQQRLEYLTQKQFIQLPGHHHFHCEPEYVDDIAAQIKQFLQSSI